LIFRSFLFRTVYIIIDPNSSPGFIAICEWFVNSPEAVGRSSNEKIIFSENIENIKITM